MGLSTQHLENIQNIALCDSPGSLPNLLREVAMLLNGEAAWLCLTALEEVVASRSEFNLPPLIPSPFDAGALAHFLPDLLAVGIGDRGTLLVTGIEAVTEQHAEIIAELVPWMSAAAALYTARKRNEEATARYQALLYANFEGVCLHQDGLLIEANQALADLYGCSREDLLGMHVSALAAPEVLPRIKAIVSSGYDGAYETVALRHDGTRLPLEARGKAAIFRGQPVRVAAFRDLRERKRAEQELIAAREAAEEASRIKTRFLGNMSHELRTPLAGIIGLSRLLLQTPLSDTQRSHMSVLTRAAEGLVGLLGDLLDITRIEEDRVVLDPQPFDLPELVEQTTHIIQPEVTRRGLELSVSCPPDLAPIWVGDARRIQQILINLLSNAVKFTLRGRVSLSLSADNVGVYFAVADTGIGMSAADRTRIFDRFYQVDSTTRGGSGLGLNITRSLTEMMGGSISADSQPEGGSVFLVSLPLRPGRPAPPLPALPSPGPPLRILLAEDHPVNQLVVRHTLEHMGHTVTVVDNGEVAIQHASEGDFDLILMDIQMPLMDGLTATRILRASAPPVTIPIVALTARAMRADRDSCLEAGMDDYLTKPISDSSFLAMLARIDPHRA